MNHDFIQHLRSADSLILFGLLACLLLAYLILPLWHSSQGRNYYMRKKSIMIKETFPEFPKCTKIINHSDSEEFVSYKIVSNIFLPRNTKRKINKYITYSSDHEVDLSVRWLGNLSNRTESTTTQEFLNNKVNDEFSAFLRRLNDVDLDSTSISDEIKEFSRRPSICGWRQFINLHRTEFLQYTVPLEAAKRWIDYIGRGTSIGLLIGTLVSQFSGNEIEDFMSQTSLIGAVLGGSSFGFVYFKSRIPNTIQNYKDLIKKLVPWILGYIIIVSALTVLLRYISFVFLS